MERKLLYLLLENEEPFWRGVEEVMHVSGDPVLALDALAGLGAAGLIQRKGDYVLITRATLRAYQLMRPAASFHTLTPQSPQP
jgi:hypothetical protein